MFDFTLPVIALGVALAFPNWLLLILGVPLFIVLSNIALVPPLFSIGTADIQSYDLIILIVFLKVAGFLALSRHRIYMRPYLPIGAFLMVALGATLIGYIRFGSEVFVSEMVAFSRFVAQISIFFLIIHSIRTARQLELSYQLFHIVGYTIAASIYVNLALFSFGVSTSYAQATEATARYFGPLGDQVGFILPLFLYKELISQRVPKATFFGGALLLTGTRGALITLGIGLIILLLYMHREHSREREYLLPIATFFGIIGLALWFDFGGMLARFVTPEMRMPALTQRVTTITIATRIFVDNILVGLGFTGFRFAALDYSAEAIFSQKLYYASAFIATASNQYLQVATDAGILGLVTFLWMANACLRTLKRAQGCVTGGLRDSFRAGYIWLLSLLIGNQMAVWLLPGSIISYLLWVILGIAAVTIAMMQSAVPNNAGKAADSTLLSRFSLDAG